MAAILKNGCHFFPAEYPEGRPHRKCAEMSSEQAHTHEPFTTAHVSRTLFAPWVHRDRDVRKTQKQKRRSERPICGQLQSVT